MTIDTKRLRQLHENASKHEPVHTLTQHGYSCSGEFYRAAHAALPELLDELERLREELDSCSTTTTEGVEIVVDLKAENARLLADVRRLREERDWERTYRLRRLVQVDLIDPSEVPEPLEHTDVVLELWLKEKGY